MNKKTLWVVTGALGIVGLGAGVASAAGGVGGEAPFDNSPAVQVSNAATSPSATPSAATIDLTTTPPSAIANDLNPAPPSAVAGDDVSVDSTVSTVSTVSPVSPVSVQSAISAESTD